MVSNTFEKSRYIYYICFKAIIHIGSLTISNIFTTRMAQSKGYWSTIVEVVSWTVFVNWCYISISQILWYLAKEHQSLDSFIKHLHFVDLSH